MPSISIVIPTYNVASCLEATVRSAVEQTTVPIEILIIDNNSTDNTLHIARELAAKHGHLIRVLQESRQGAPFARNQGLAEAKGEWIQYLDADDLLLPQKLEYQMGFTGPHFGFVAGAATERSVDGTETSRPVMQDVWKGLFTGGGYLGYTSSNLWSASALHAVGGWDTSLSRNQEYDLMFRVLSEGYQGAVAPEVHTIKQERAAGQITDTSYVEYLLSSFPMRYRILQYALRHPEIDDDTIRYFFKMYYRFYSRLRVRSADDAIYVRKQFFDPLMTSTVIKRYPSIRYFRLRSGIYAVLKHLKKLIGRRGVLGKLSGAAHKT